MGSVESVAAAVERIVRENLPDHRGQELDPTADLFGLGLDSLNLIAIVVTMESEFSISFGLGELDVERFRTLDSICELVRSLDRG